jgi:hypothetical protein
MPKDYEWNQFIERDPHFVNPNTPLRKVDDIEYPGKTHPAAAEVRAGMLERKSKYLKSYTPGWYVLRWCLFVCPANSAGTYFHRLIFTNSNQQIASTRSHQSCLCS